MKLYFGIFCILLAQVGVNTLAIRQRRDVSELQSPSSRYLPPNIKSELPDTDTALGTTTELETETETTEPPTSVKGPNGYEYRAVRRLKYRYRTQRDVSHLFAERPHQQYLPPHNEYLQPQADEDDDSILIEAPTLKVAKDYLPPTENEVLNTEPPTTEASAQTTISPDVEGESTEPPQDTAVLSADGYHYKKPEVPFELEPDFQVSSNEYLPPLEKGVVEAEGPEEESAILADDGYHYRVIRRLRF